MPNAFHPSLLDPLRNLIATLLAIVETRLGLLSLDLKEASSYIVVALILAGMAYICFSLVILLAAFFVVAFFWDSYRLLSLGILIAVLLLGGLGFWFAVRRQIKAMSELFMGTRDELAKDVESLSGTS